MALVCHVDRTTVSLHFIFSVQALSVFYDTEGRSHHPFFSDLNGRIVDFQVSLTFWAVWNPLMLQVFPSETVGTIRDWQGSGVGGPTPADRS